MDATTDGQAPSSDGSNGEGRDAQGRFAKGWKGGTGNPHAKRVAALRSALLGAVSPEDLRVIVEKLIEKAKAGDLLATKELFDRILGKSTQPIAGDVGVSVHQVLTPEQHARAVEIARKFDSIITED